MAEAAPNEELERIERSVREDRPDFAPGSAPDGTVTIVFSDIESSTVILERLGDAGFLRMLAGRDRISPRSCRAASGLRREVAGRLGGEILESDLVHSLVRGLGTFEFATPRRVN